MAKVWDVNEAGEPVLIANVPVQELIALGILSPKPEYFLGATWEEAKAELLKRSGN